MTSPVHYRQQQPSSVHQLSNSVDGRHDDGSHSDQELSGQVEVGHYI